MSEIEKALLLISAINTELKRGTIHIQRSNNKILYDISSILKAIYNNDLDIIWIKTN